MIVRGCTPEDDGSAAAPSSGVSSLLEPCPLRFEDTPPNKALAYPGRFTRLPRLPNFVPEDSGTFGSGVASDELAFDFGDLGFAIELLS
jgi:hypothetical protein